MSSQEPPKKKSKRDNGLFCLYSERTCVDVMYFVPVCTSAYHMEKHKTHNGCERSMSVAITAHAQSLTMHHPKTHLNVPHGGSKLECCCIYRNCYQLLIEFSGRQGSVTYGLGADISLPPYLAFMGSASVCLSCGR